MLFQMQHERRKYGEGDLDGLEPMGGAPPAAAPETGPGAAAHLPSGGSDPVAEAPQTAAATAGQNAGQNETKATQVAGGVEGGAITSAAAAAIAVVPAGAGLDRILALIEAARRELDEPRKEDRLE